MDWIWGQGWDFTFSIIEGNSMVVVTTLCL